METSNVVELKPELNLSLYAKYVIEREGKEIIESEVGFATYYFLDDNCYIQNIFVEKDYRKIGEASRLAQEIEKIAKSKGCKKLYGTVCPSANGSTESIKVLLAYGFKLDSSINNLIAFVKDLGV